MATPAELAAMGRAIELAAAFNPHPNPRVGAVIVDSRGAVIAEGAHRGPGHPHAEVAALTSLSGPLPAGSVMIVTLEPCNHHGRTPPCTESLIEAGIARVVVGATDPDARVAGTGLARLVAAGIDVENGVLAADVEQADPAYFHHRRHGRPLVTLKTAATLDGQTAAADGSSQWITSPEARADAHRLRAGADAVVVGSGTLVADDPLLTVRAEGYAGPQPIAVVVAGARPLPPRALVWERPGTLVVASRQLDAPAELILVDGDSEGRPRPEEAVRALGDRGLLALLVEGGATLASAWWSAGVVDQGVTYLGARMAGGIGTGMFAAKWTTLDSARPVEITGLDWVGPDVRVDWSV